MTAADAFQQTEDRLLTHYRIARRSRFLQLSDPPLRARVLEFGSGEPVLFIHGGGGYAAQWAPLAAHLGEVHGFAVDRPGCGLTDAIDYRNVPDLREHAVRFLAGVLDALQLDRAAVVANSMGGLWSFWFALEHPERVSQLVQLGAPALFPGTNAPFLMRLLSVRGLNRRLLRMQPPSLPQVRSLYSEILGHSRSVEQERFPKELFESHVAFEQLPAYEIGWLTLLEKVYRLRGARPAVALDGAELRRIRQPVLFLWGDHDPFGTPEVGRRALEAMPDAHLQVVPGGGHLPWLDEPEQCAACIRGFFRR